MASGKTVLLSRLSRRARFFKRVQVGERIEGSSPPSVFIGRQGYPRVCAGPLVPPAHGDTRVMDAPEQWLGQYGDKADIINFRLQLVRGKKRVHVKEQSRTIEMIQEIALAERSPEVEARFTKQPAGVFFHEEVQPFGPSAPVKEMSVDAGRWDSRLEKAFYDTDLKAGEGIMELYEKGVPVSSIQRALSAGALGLERNRKLVPTRWSITAVDSALSEKALDDVKANEPIEEFRVYEHESFSNKFVVVLAPTLWNYEWVEAFFPQTPGDRLEVFSDREGFEKKKEYSSVGGCYYSVRLAVAEALAREGRQAGALVLREAASEPASGSVRPKAHSRGSSMCRESARKALSTEPARFDSFKQAVECAYSRLRVRRENWYAHSQTIQNPGAQTKLAEYC